MNEQKILRYTLQLTGIGLLVLLCLLMWCPPDSRPPFLREMLQDYKVHYGLDIKGGSRLIYEIDPGKITSGRSVEDVLDHTRLIIERRILDAEIVKDPIIQTLGENRISVQLPGVSEEETDNVKEQIETLGRLQFRMVAARCAEKIEVSKKVCADSIDPDEEWKKFQRKQRSGTEALEEYEKDLLGRGFRWFPDRNNEKAMFLLWMADGYSFEGEKFETFRASFEPGKGNTVLFELKEEHKPNFAELMDRFRGEDLAIVYNEKVVMAPKIDEDHPPTGSGTITGSFTKQEVDTMVTILRSGSLEIQPEFLQRKFQGARYGEDTIQIGVAAGLVGLLIVMLFMVFYYRGAGIIACVALTLNIVILMAILVIFKETLTLPGIAGIILTMGMSVDANIIIFERIREEKQKRSETAAPAERKRKKEAEPEKKAEDKPQSAATQQELLESVDQGHSNAFGTILDANLTTLLTALILYFLASGTVQGFAFTLGVGILASFFTAIVVSHLLLRFGIEMGWIRELRMQEWVTNPRFLFVKWMRRCIVGSVALIVLGIGLFLSLGDSIYGLDMRGGVEAHIALRKSLPTPEVQERTAQVLSNLQSRLPEAMREKSAPTPEVHRFTQKAELEGWAEFSITIPNLNQTALDAKNRELRELWRQRRVLFDEQKMIANRINNRRNHIGSLEQDLLFLQRSGDASEREILATQDQIRSYEEEIQNETKSLDKLGEEIKVFGDKEKVLQDERRKLVNLDELKAEFSRSFQDVLAPLPYGKMNQARWGADSKLFYHLPVNMYTPVPVSYVRNQLGIGGGEVPTKDFLRIELGSPQYFVSIRTAPVPDIAKEKAEEKAEKAPEKTPDELLRDLQKSFMLEADMELKQEQVEIQKLPPGKWDYRIVFRFTREHETEKENGEKAVETVPNPVPQFIVKEVLDACKFGGHEIAINEDSQAELREFDLFFTPSAKTAALEEEEIEQLARETAGHLQKGVHHERPVYLSEPFPILDQVSGAVARAQKAKAYRAIVMALLILLLYIAVRFPNGIRFGIGAVIALAHDVLITIAAMAACFALGIVDVRMDLPAIAALLTIVGYSLNDTIIIFDRIRENRRKSEVWDRLNRSQLAAEFDKSLNQTLSRTLFTALTTLFVVLCIFVMNFGRGTVLEGFSFILIVGITVGTYSSLFIATPIAYLWERAEHPQ